eukprot:Skav234287  [mRNA]  locus=scaffold2271:110356:115778:+ [translate_table: standard]
MYFVWRRAYDNFSRTSDHVFAPKVGAGAVCSAPSVGQRQAAASAGVTLERSEESCRDESHADDSTGLSDQPGARSPGEAPGKLPGHGIAACFAQQFGSEGSV